jgi:hypothetical protein
LPLHVAVADLLRRHLLPRVCSFLGTALVPADPGQQSSAPAQHNQMHRKVGRHRLSERPAGGGGLSAARLRRATTLPSFGASKSVEAEIRAATEGVATEVAGSDSGSDSEWSQLSCSSESEDDGSLSEVALDNCSTAPGSPPFANFLVKGGGRDYLDVQAAFDTSIGSGRDWDESLGTASNEGGSVFGADLKVSEKSQSSGTAVEAALEHKTPVLVRGSTFPSATDSHHKGR